MYRNVLKSQFLNAHLAGGMPARGGVWRPPPVTATAAGGTHPTGMHSCYLHVHRENAVPRFALFRFIRIYINLFSRLQSTPESHSHPHSPETLVLWA